MTKEANAGQKTILCVDDDASMLSALRRVLSRLSFRVLTAGGGDEGVRVARQEKPDLIIMDLMMPGLDGFEAIKRLRNSGLTETPIILLTAKDSGDAVMRGYAHGCVCYITKPFKNEHVVNVVQYLIGDLSEPERECLALKL